MTNEKRRSRLSAKYCKDCDDMQELIKEWGDFKVHLGTQIESSQKTMSSNFWKIAALMLTILLFSTGMTMDTRDKLNEKVETETLDSYLTKKDFLIYQDLKWAKMEQILSYERGALPDSLIIDAAQNWKYIVDIVFQTDESRGVFDSNNEYEKAIRKILNKE